MSQIVTTKAKTQTLYPDIVFVPKNSTVATQARIAECYVCGKGLGDGHSLTGKMLSSETVLFL